MPRSDDASEGATETEGTKRCPYCAEVIQAAAIRCRYCRSDLDDVPAAAPAPQTPPAPPTSATQLGPAAAPQPPPPSPVAGTTSSSPRWRSWGRTSWIAAAVAALITVALLATSAFFWLQAEGIEDERQAARTARAAVTEKVELLLTYDHETFDEDAAAAEEVLTPEFRKEYEPTREAIRDRAVRQQRSQQATVAAVSVLSQDADEVETLLFVDTVSAREGGQRQRVLQNRVKVTLTRDGDTWLIDDLTVPQS